MANTLIPVEERDLNPDQVEALDKRRRRGLMFQVVSVQFAIISAVLLLWVGQDIIYSPGWAHPIDYYFILTILICITSGITGVVLRHGNPEF